MIPGFMTRQIAASQQDLLARLIFDVSFAKEMAKHPLHACLVDGLPHQPKAKVLELGCGPGKYVAMLSSLGFDVIGADPFEFPSWDTISRNTAAELRSGVFAEKLPFPDHYFDHAVCLGALLYFDSPELALRELRRVLKPGARIVLRTVNSENPYTRRTGKKLDPASKNLFTMADLTRLVESAGFRVTRSFTYGFWPAGLTNFWWYLVCVWIPLRLQDWLSDHTPSALRVNNTIFAVRD